MLGILNGDLTEQLTAGHDIAGVLLRCGFLMTLSIGAWQDMRNHRIKLSLIVMSAAAGAVLRCMYIVLDADDYSIVLIGLDEKQIKQLPKGIIGIRRK